MSAGRTAWPGPSLSHTQDRRCPGLVSAVRVLWALSWGPPLAPVASPLLCHVMGVRRDRRPAWLPQSELHPFPGSGRRPAGGTDILQPMRHVNAHCSAAAPLRLIRLLAGRPWSHWHLESIIAQTRLAGYTRWLRRIYLFWLISTVRDACSRGLSPPHTRADCSETGRTRRCLPQARCPFRLADHFGRPHKLGALAAPARRTLTLGPRPSVLTAYDR